MLVGVSLKNLEEWKIVCMSPSALPLALAGDMSEAFLITLNHLRGHQDAGTRYFEYSSDIHDYPFLCDALNWIK